MKALLLAATSSLALTGFAVAQTTTTTTETPAVTPMQDAAVAVDNAADAAGDAAKDAAAAAGDAADAAGDAAKAAGHDVVEGAEKAADAAGDVAKDAAEDAEKAADAAGDVARDAAEDAEKAAEKAGEAVDTAVTDATAPAADVVVVAPDVNAPVMSAENPGMLGSYIMNRRIWTTNQPSSTTWSDTTLTERPADWVDIAKVDDIVVDPEGNILGYVADIGGFLGLGAKSVLLGKDALHLVTIGDEAFFATNYTKEELQALPDFDRNTVLK